jgi:hypothetical protein
VFGAFYGEGPDWDNTGWREMAAFSAYVLRPLEWSGFLSETTETLSPRHVRHYFKTPLWRSAFNLDTDNMLSPVRMQ